MYVIYYGCSRVGNYLLNHMCKTHLLALQENVKTNLHFQFLYTTYQPHWVILFHIKLRYNIIIMFMAGKIQMTQTRSKLLHFMVERSMISDCCTGCTGNYSTASGCDLTVYFMFGCFEKQTLFSGKRCNQNCSMHVEMCYEVTNTCIKKVNIQQLHLTFKTS